MVLYCIVSYGILCDFRNRNRTTKDRRPTRHGHISHHNFKIRKIGIIVMWHLNVRYFFRFFFFLVFLSLNSVWVACRGRAKLDKSKEKTTTTQSVVVKHLFYADADAHCLCSFAILLVHTVMPRQSDLCFVHIFQLWRGKEKKNESHRTDLLTFR